MQAITNSHIIRGASMPIIQTSQLQFAGIINYPDIDIKEGVLTFLSGPSGSGKTTLFRLFNDTLTPTAGDIYYKGKSVTEYDPIELRRNILLVNQSVFLFEDSIQNNFQRFYEYCNLPIPALSKITSLLDICAIPLDPAKSVTNLSGGERQRVFTAICLSFIPNILLLDEPTSALDEEVAHKFMTNIKNFCKNRGITIIVITHDTNLIHDFNDDIVYLKKD